MPQQGPQKIDDDLIMKGEDQIGVIRGIKQGLWVQNRICKISSEYSKLLDIGGWLQSREQDFSIQLPTTQYDLHILFTQCRVPSRVANSLTLEIGTFIGWGVRGPPPENVVFLRCNFLHFIVLFWCTVGNLSKILIQNVSQITSISSLDEMLHKHSVKKRKKCCQD